MKTVQPLETSFLSAYSRDVTVIRIDSLPNTTEEIHAIGKLNYIKPIENGRYILCVSPLVRFAPMVTTSDEDVLEEFTLSSDRIIADTLDNNFQPFILVKPTVYRPENEFCQVLEIHSDNLIAILSRRGDHWRKVSRRIRVDLMSATMKASV